MLNLYIQYWPKAHHDLRSSAKEYKLICDSDHILNMDSDKIRFTSILDKIPSDSTRVLDIGCVRHSEESRNKGNLHERIVENVRGEVIGIDINKKEIEKMREEGFNVHVENAEKINLDKNFNVVVAGEVIEHLSNPGIFLKSAGSVLEDGGLIVLSTPNPDGFAYFRKGLLGQNNNPTHTCWIDPSNLEVLVNKTERLEMKCWEYLPPVGGVSMILWKLGYDRASSPGYVAVLEKK